MICSSETDQFFRLRRLWTGQVVFTWGSRVLRIVYDGRWINDIRGRRIVFANPNTVGVTTETFPTVRLAEEYETERLELNGGTNLRKI